MTHKTKIQPWFLLLIVAVAMVFVGPLRSAFAGCSINVAVKNTGELPLGVKNHSSTGVKIKLGTWKKLEAGNWFWLSDEILLDPGQKQSDTYKAEFNCGAKRRYKIYYWCKGGNEGRSFTKYYPSPTGWTERQSLTVNLGRCK